MSVELPYVKVYVQDMVAELAHLSLEERGAYLTLILHMWTAPGCRLPDNAKWISNLLPKSARWSVLRSTLVDGFRPLLVVENGYLISPWLQTAYPKAQKNRQSAVDAANIRHHGTAHIEAPVDADAYANGHADAYANHNHNHNQTGTSLRSYQSTNSAATNQPPASKPGGRRQAANPTLVTNHVGENSTNGNSFASNLAHSHEDLPPPAAADFASPNGLTPTTTEPGPEELMAALASKQAEIARAGISAPPVEDVPKPKKRKGKRDLQASADMPLATDDGLVDGDPAYDDDDDLLPWDVPVPSEDDD